jgi:PAS domain S-box-containing protein
MASSKGPAMTRFSLLVISDSEELASAIVTRLSAHGLEPAYNVVSSPLRLAQTLADEPWDIVMAASELPGMPWEESLAITRAAREHLPFLLVAEQPSPQAAIAAMHDGADDYLCLTDWSFAPAVQRALIHGGAHRQLNISLETHRMNEEKYRRVIDDSMVGIFRCTPWGRLTSYNPAFTRILGYESPEAFETARKAALDLPHIDAETQESILTLVEEHGRIRDFETRIHRVDGSSIWVSLSARAIRGDSGEFSAVEGSIEDIDRRKRVEAMIIRAKQEWERTFDSVPDVIAILDRNFTLRRMNMALATRLGLHPKQAVGLHWSKLLPPMDDHSTALQQLRAMSQSDGEVVDMDLPGLGGVFLVSVSPFHVDRAVDEDADGFVLVAHDISSRKQLEAKLRQSQKLEAIGTLAGGIAHDFNNILGVIMGYAEMTLEDATPETVTERRLTEIINAGRRARDLIHQILTFSRQEELALRPLQLDSVVKEVTKMLRASLPANVNIITDLPPASAAVMANLSQIHQVIMNLCTNAAHAMRATGGTLRVSLADTTLVTEDGAARAAVLLTVADTGTGIPDEILDNVFDPFFTTKKPDEGTGMGLAMVHGIVSSHGGTVSVDSPPGEGATFRVVLPAADIVPTGTEEPATPRPSAKGRALFIDDEKALATIGGEMLDSLGFTTSVATSSLDALEVFKSAPNEFDLVVTDQSMPGLTGEALAKEILALRPDVPIIICTGYSEDISAERARSIGIRGFLLKPMLKKDLAASIDAALRSPAE